MQMFVVDEIGFVSNIEAQTGGWDIGINLSFDGR